MQVHITRSGIGGVYGHPVTRCDAGGCAAGTELYYADLVPSQWKEGDIAEAVPETAPGRPEAPIPCVNCGSPACEWPGRCGASGNLLTPESAYHALDGPPEQRIARLRQIIADVDALEEMEVWHIKLQREARVYLDLVEKASS